MKRRALISVSDKTNIEVLAKALHEQGMELVSTGGTKKKLQEAGLPVLSVSEVTGYPEILDGRVKTLHPKIHSGLLAIRGNEDHDKQMEELDLTHIDVVVVNLYPFQQTISNPSDSYADAIENIDIGGPSMIRAAAKNYNKVTVLVDAEDYTDVLRQLQETGEVNISTRRRLAAKAFRHTASYDALIAQYMSEQVNEPWPERLTVTYERLQTLRYGENPHQKAALYKQLTAPTGYVTTAKQLHGKELSYNNINDANTALEIVRGFETAAAVAVKHMNPCGVGVGESAEAAFQKAYKADPVSIFGGIIAFNRTVDLATAKQLHELFLEIILAPDFTDDALELLTRKKNIRLLKLGELEAASYCVPTAGAPTWKLNSIGGGALVQSADEAAVNVKEWKVVSKRQPEEAEWEQMDFAWRVVKHVKSNAIVLVNDGVIVGIGAGQMNRVGAAKIAIDQAGPRSKGAILASDAFFPMGDTVEIAAEAGIRAIVQPGGSIRDEESIAAANSHDMAMVFTEIRHFKH